MKFISDYSMPLAAALLLSVFFLCLPDLKSCILTQSGSERRKLCRADALIMAVITVIYACVGFYKLGDRVDPQSFVNMEAHCASFILPEEECDKILFYTGIGIGSYELVYHAENAEEPVSLTTFSQSHADVLKWHTIDLFTPIKGGSVEIYGNGNVWLGEVVFLNWNDEPLQVNGSDEELFDEQSTFRLEQTYMNSTFFDEIYHARTAWEHLNGINPYEITHPPLGKIIISIGIALFGMTPFGWRFSGTFFGVLMLPIMYVFLKKIFGGKAVPAAGTIVFASDFMHFVQTRISTIDTYAVFFILLMYLFMYMFITEEKKHYLALSGIFFGLGAASKWTCFYAGAGLAVIWALWVIISSKEGRLDIKGFIKNVGFCIVFFIAIPVLIYSLSYIPYAAARGNMKIFSGDYFRMVWSNQEYMFNYHSGVNATHPYSSRWYQWMLNIRPILYYLQYLPDNMRSSFGAFLNPALCWGGLISLFALGYTAIFRRDRNALFILIGYLAQLLPWVFVTRITFEYHYFTCTVFLVLAIAYLFEVYRCNMKLWKAYVFGFTAFSVILFILFYPALSGKPIDNHVASVLIGWLPTWPF